MARLLLQQGAAVDVTDGYGQTSLISVCKRGSGHEGVVRLLQQQGAAVDAAAPWPSNASAHIALPLWHCAIVD